MGEGSLTLPATARCWNVEGLRRKPTPYRGASCSACSGVGVLTKRRCRTHRNTHKQEAQEVRFSWSFLLEASWCQALEETGSGEGHLDAVLSLWPAHIRRCTQVNSSELWYIYTEWCHYQLISVSFLNLPVVVARDFSKRKNVNSVVVHQTTYFDHTGANQPIDLKSQVSVWIIITQFQTWNWPRHSQSSQWFKHW